jgi:hypothetical protein
MEEQPLNSHSPLRDGNSINNSTNSNLSNYHQKSNMNYNDMQNSTSSNNNKNANISTKSNNRLMLPQQSELNLK